MFVSKKLLAVLSVVILTGCSITQPKAPLVDGLVKNNQKTQAPKQLAKPEYKTIKKVIYVDKKVYHKVKKGEYVYAIARKYKVSPYKIIKQNKLKKPYTLSQGKKLYIKTVKVKKIVDDKVLVKTKQYIPARKDRGYSLTRNPKLYNKNTASYRKQPAIPRQDPRRVNSNKNLDFGVHKVRRGENLFRIGRKYSVSVFDLMAYNDIKSPQDLKSGIELKIPVAKKEKAVKAPKAEKTTASSTTLNFEKVDPKMAQKKGFIYPVKGKIISKFGKQGHGIRNDGIDIAVKMGTPVRAAQSGTIRYAEEVSTLGNMVLIKHRSGYISAYTHNSKLLVKKGNRVVKGQVIALSGDSGNAKQPMLHFELRRYGKSLNPTRILH